LRPIFATIEGGTLEEKREDGEEEEEGEGEGVAVEGECDANDGELFEIDSFGNKVWKYISPVGLNGITIQGNNPVGNMVFHCTYLPANYQGFQGQTLTAGSPIELNPLNYLCNDVATSVNDESNSKSFRSFPDPFHENFSIESRSELKDAGIRIYDAVGKLLKEEKNVSLTPNESYQINLKNYSGLVMLTLLDSAGKIKLSQLLVAQ